MTKKTVGWNSSYFGEAKPGSLKDVINGITSKQNALVGDKPHVADPITPEQVAAKEKFTKEERYTVSIETNKNDKSDDGEGLDAVQPKAVKKKFADRKDKDIDNDGDVDSSDKFLHKRRKAVSKAMAKEKPSKDHAEDEKEEAAGAKRTAGATEAEPMTKGDEDKKMKAGHPVDKAAYADNSDAAEKATKPAAMRGNDNKQAEKSIKPSATKDTANKVKEETMKKTGKESIDDIAAAYASMYAKDEDDIQEAEKLDELSPDYLHRAADKQSKRTTRIGSLASRQTAAGRSNKKTDSMYDRSKARQDRFRKAANAAGDRDAEKRYQASIKKPRV